MSAWGEWIPVEGRSFETILYSKRHRTRGGGVARILLNRPANMNAFSPKMADELTSALLEANRDRSIGVIVLSHTGPHFGVGGDVTALQDAVSSGEVLIGGITPDTVFGRCLKPVIAAVRGYVIGMHHHMAYHCDYTIAGESAVFGQNGPRVGSPASGAIVAASVNVIGMKRAKELWMRCRQLSPQEALDAGLINSVVQDRLIEAEVERWCDDLLDRVPVCIAAIKQTFTAANASIMFTDNFLTMIEPDFAGQLELAEAGASFFEKRPPNFWTEEMTAARF